MILLQRWAWCHSDIFIYFTLIHSFIHLFIHWIFLVLSIPLPDSFIHWFIHSFMYFPYLYQTHSFIHFSFIHYFKYSSHLSLIFLIAIWLLSWPPVCVYWVEGKATGSVSSFGYNPTYSPFRSLGTIQSSLMQVYDILGHWLGGYGEVDNSYKWYYGCLFQLLDSS